MNNELLQSYINAIPGFDLVANKEVAIPLYHYNSQFLYTENRALPIVDEFVLELSKESISLSDIQQLLGCPTEVINDAFYNLIQLDFFDLDLNRITGLGEDYLASHSLERLEKGEFEILVNTLTGDIDVNVNNSILQRDAQRFYCYKAIIKSFSPDDLKFDQMNKVLRTYCEKNEFDKNSKLIDIINLTKKSTRYRKIELLIYQNGNGENRILAIENGKRKNSYEEILTSLDSRGYDLLHTDVDDFFESSNVISILDLYKDRSITEGPDLFSTFTRISNPTLIIPFVENPYLNDFLLREIEKKLMNEDIVTIYFCGKKLKNSYQENMINKVQALTKKKKNLKCYHLPHHMPLMCYSDEEGVILLIKKSNLNLCNTKTAILSYFDNMESDHILKVKTILTSLQEQNPNFSIKPMPNMYKLEKLWLDFDSHFTTLCGFSLFLNGEIKDKQSFLTLSESKNKAQFNDFLNIINKSFFESIKSRGKKETNDKNFFWNIFKKEFPSLFKVLDKVRVYRNNADHIELDNKNEELFYNYLNEDTNGIIIEFVPNGYEYIQSLLLNQMQDSLREIV